jgi:hypothetical protein
MEAASSVQKTGLWLCFACHLDVAVDAEFYQCRYCEWLIDDSKKREGHSLDAQPEAAAAAEKMKVSANIRFTF